MRKMCLERSRILVLLGTLVVGALLISGCIDTKTTVQIVKDISVIEAYSLIQKNKDSEDFVIIDVRTPEEFANEHIENAINLDYYSEDFRDELDTLDKERTYLIYCRSGKRSGNALKIMKELGLKKVFNMLGGIIQWKAEGYPLQQWKAQEAIVLICAVAKIEPSLFDLSSTFYIMN